jgi:hypothetical protein
MAVVKGIKEVIHLPLYDSIFVRPREQFGLKQSSNVLRFFQDVTGKTKLQTNMQAASLLPHWNTFEARALRVVISDLPPQLPDNLAILLSFGVFKLDDYGNVMPVLEGTPAVQKTATVETFRLSHFVDFTRRLEELQEPSFRLAQPDLLVLDLTKNAMLLLPGEFIVIDRTKLKEAENALASAFGKDIIPPREQLLPHNGFGNVIGKFIYNTITTFFVGEKIMIQVPTWFFPAGAGPYSEDGQVTTHGYPNPQATFRFAEPINIDTQQNFRVEIEIPENEVLSALQRLYGPLFIWVVVDGFMTRDVQ